MSSFSQAFSRFTGRYPGCIILSDCCGDTNGAARLSMRWQSLTGDLPQALPVKTSSEAGLTLQDMLLAGSTALGRKARPGIIIINKATRGNRENWPNGTPFCWFRYKGNLVVATWDIETLALVREHLDVVSVNVTDAETVVTASDRWCSPPLSNAEKTMLCETQFRSLWYQLLLAIWVWERRKVPCRHLPIPQPLPELKVLVEDAFGNLKTNGSPSKLGLVDGKWVEVVFPSGRSSTLAYHRQLATVPRGELALVKGSSGPGLLEIMLQGGSAALELQCQLKAGDSFQVRSLSPALTSS